MSKINRNETGGGFFLVLFGLPFLLAGIGVLYVASTWWIDYFATGSWERVPMDIVSVEFKEYEGDDTDTFNVLCNYTYEFKGKTYNNDKVTIETSSSNSSRHGERYEQILEYKDVGRKFVGFVNPKNLIML